MIRRTVLLALALIFAVADTASWAQQTNKIPVVGYLALVAGPDDPIVKGLRQGLLELGYVEGHTMRIEFRTAQGHADRLPGLAKDLVQLKVDVIVALSTLPALAVKRATSTVPIVVGVIADPVGSGLVTNLAYPGGNVTGLSAMTTELSALRLQLLKEAVPHATRVAVLWNPDMPFNAKVVEDIKAVAPSLSIELKFVGARTPEEIGAAFTAAKRSRAQALYLVDSPLFYIHQMTLAKLASKVRLPTIYGTRRFAEEGGLMSYGVDYTDQMRRSAVYVDKILKGAKPADLPIEQPTKFELVVNLKTAKALGIAIPQSILLRADEVIR